eukprot:symbB.v1.2.037014.t1/scaffold5357.1/size51943/1
MSSPGVKRYLDAHYPVWDGHGKRQRVKRVPPVSPPMELIRKTRESQEVPEAAGPDWFRELGWEEATKMMEMAQKILDFNHTIQELLYEAEDEIQRLTTLNNSLKDMIKQESLAGAATDVPAEFSPSEGPTDLGEMEEVLIEDEMEEVAVEAGS